MRTILCKSLNDCADYHDYRATHNRPSSSEALVNVRCERHDDDRTKLVASTDKTQHRWLQYWFSFGIPSTIREVYIQLA